MTNAWDNTTPVAGNIVRDTTPPEIQGLKTVNLNRLRLACRGYTGFTWANGGAGTAVQPFLGLMSDLTVGTYNAALGEYTVDQAGLFKIEAQIDRWFGGLGNSTACSIAIQLFTGGVWVDNNIIAYDLGASVSPVRISGILLAAVGEKIRIVQKVTTSSAAGATIANGTAVANFSMIEFLRTP